MVNKAKKGFYDNLSRKELQNMCKLYGLPANRSHSELEKSLFACLEEGINSSISNLQTASPIKCNGSSLNRRKAQRKSSTGNFLSFPRGNLVEIMPQTKCRDAGDDRSPAENIFASSVETSAKVCSSPFEFHVRSEEGINLFVDLNSSPSDWNQKFKNEVHIFENVQNNKSRSLHEDLGCLKEGDKEMRSSFWNIPAGEIRDGHIDTQSSLSSKTTKDDHSGLDQREKGEASPHAIQPCSTSADVSDESMVAQPLKSSDLNSGAQDHVISVGDSCAKDGCTMVLGSDIIDAPDINSVHDTAVNSIYSNPSSPVTLEHPNSDLSQCQNTILQNDSSFVNPSIICRGCSVSGSIEIQSSEVASCNKDENGVIGVFDTKHYTETEKYDLAKTSDVNPDVNGNHFPVPAEEGEKSNILNETESSGCSLITKSLKKTGFSSDNTETTEGHKRKRSVEDKNQSSNARANTKILRSMKRFPRRSMRLMSK